MKIKFTIGRRIGIGFSVLILLNIIGFYLTIITLNESRSKTESVTQVYNPSVRALEGLNGLVVRSKMLINYWVGNQSSIDNDKLPYKKQLIKLIDEDYPVAKSKLLELSKSWANDERDSVNVLLNQVEALLASYQTDIMSQLKTFDDYEDPLLLLPAKNNIEEGDIYIKTKLILMKLTALIQVQEGNTREVNGQMIKAFGRLQMVVWTLGFALIVIGVVIAFGTVRSIVQPVTQLRSMLVSMGRGVSPQGKMPHRDDEIGDMSVALNVLVEGMRRTTEFAHEVGSGNFVSEYKPLSDEDTLGHALLRMRTDLAENERVLEAKVIERTEEVVRQKEEIESQNQKLAVLYKHVTDSIRYAKRIQDSILPPDQLFKTLLPNSFVLFRPKDIVSGDFYWISEKDGKILFTAIDCTGHGVPGAFMSIVGYNILKEVITHTAYTSPGDIMAQLNEGVSETLHQQGYEDSAKDGMDVAFCTLDYRTLELEYAGAYNPLFLVRDGQLQQINANKFPLGFFVGKDAKKFTNHKIQLQKGDVVYIFSDGYADQFGGPNGKKFMASQFRDLLVRIHQLPVDDQKQMLDSTIVEWMGDHEQVDDMLVIGVKI